MSLNTQVIGKTMPHGFAGSYARQPDMIVNTRPAGGKVNIPFGTALMYEGGKVVVMSGTGTTANKFAGVAGSEIKSALSYTDQNTGVYAPGDAAVCSSAAASMCCASAVRPLSAATSMSASRPLPTILPPAWAALRLLRTTRPPVTPSNCPTASGAAQQIRTVWPSWSSSPVQMPKRRAILWQISRTSAPPMPVFSP